VAYHHGRTGGDALVGWVSSASSPAAGRGRVFAYDQYLETLSEGAEALGAARDQEGDVV